MTQVSIVTVAKPSMSPHLYLVECLSFSGNSVSSVFSNYG